MRIESQSWMFSTPSPDMSSNMSTRPRLVLVTNIPSPYRLHTFALLHDEMLRRGFALEVLFMAANERGRHWPAKPEEWEFPGRVTAGFHPNLLGMEMHLNLGVWSSVLRSRPRWLIIGGGWQFPTSLGLFMLKPFYRRRSANLVWAEANHRFSSHHGGVVGFLRRALLNSADALIIPGEIAAKTLNEHWQVKSSKTIYWPNLVDESQYCERVTELRSRRAELRASYNIPDKNTVLFWSARLHEATKGILTFLEAALPVVTERLCILLAGDGPDRSRVEEWVRTHDRLNVKLLGHVPTGTVLECLALSDAAILPSLRDPNPLAIIEALWAGLPILTSVNCGNWPETVQPGQNGWLVDPAQPEQVAQAVSEILACSSQQFAAMGQKSLALAQERFDSRRAIKHFVDDLITAFPPRV
jgi:glycosyltransferase involved in cell wall biosynthesis